MNFDYERSHDEKTFKVVSNANARVSEDFRDIYPEVELEPIVLNPNRLPSIRNS